MFALGNLFMVAHWAYALYLVLSGQDGAMFCFMFGFVYLVCGILAEAIL